MKITSKGQVTIRLQNISNWPLSLRWAGGLTLVCVVVLVLWGGWQSWLWWKTPSYRLSEKVLAQVALSAPSQDEVQPPPPAEMPSKAPPTIADTLRAQTSSKSVAGGYVYRAHMVSDRVLEITPQIAQKFAP